MTLFICAIRVPIGQTHRSFQEFSRGDLVKDHVRIGRYPLNTRNKATKIGMALWCEFWRPFGVFSGLNLLLMLINAPRQTLKKRGTPKAFASGRKRTKSSCRQPSIFVSLRAVGSTEPEALVSFCSCYPYRLCRSRSHNGGRRARVPSRTGIVATLSARGSAKIRCLAQS